MTQAWPATIEGAWAGEVVRLRPLRPLADRKEFLALRKDNEQWTRRWDSTSPDGARPSRGYTSMVRMHEQEARNGHVLPFAVEIGGRLAGQMHLFSITRGALMSGAAGYWIDQRLAGCGYTPYALALLIDHAFGSAGLHRVEVNIRPDNPSSLRVVAKLAMRDEGVRAAYLHINGTWHDHRSFALTVEDLDGESAVQRLERLLHK